MHLGLHRCSSSRLGLSASDTRCAGNICVVCHRLFAPGRPLSATEAEFCFCCVISQLIRRTFKVVAPGPACQPYCYASSRLSLQIAYKKCIVPVATCWVLLQVGRTGRAGNTGLVTSLYLPQQTILTEAIKSEIDAGRPVEDTFSRNRSFRNKVKKYGRYVPRGKVVNLL